MSEIDEADVRAKAYQLWDQAGQPEGRDQEFWFAALNATSDDPASISRPQNGESKGIAPGPSGMEQTDDQDNLNNNVSNLG